MGEKWDPNMVLNQPEAGSSLHDIEVAGATASVPGLSSDLRCYCGKQFSQQSAFTNHTRTCKSTKKRLASALDLAKDVWIRRKKQKQHRLPEVNSGTLEAMVENAPMAVDESEPHEVRLS